MYEYKCKLVKVVDGDTIDVDIDLGFGVWMQNQRIRMYAIDTPESRTSDDIEKVYGNAAKAIDGQLKLLMFHSKTCSFCKAFMKEVAYDYDNKELPLIIIDAHNQPDWFKEAMKENRIKPIYGTQTFIIWNGRKELTRLIGYYDRETFYERLKGIYAKNN